MDRPHLVQGSEFHRPNKSPKVPPSDRNAAVQPGHDVEYDRISDEPGVQYGAAPFEAACAYKSVWVHCRMCCPLDAIPVSILIRTSRIPVPTDDRLLSHAPILSRILVDAVRRVRVIRATSTPGTPFQRGKPCPPTSNHRVKRAQASGTLGPITKNYLDPPSEFRRRRPGRDRCGAHAHWYDTTLEPMEDRLTTLKERVEAEPYWFHKMDLGGNIVTPGISDAARNKLPWFGLPDDMSGMRVLDVGCAEGFFSFEAERRGASEVLAYDFDPGCIRRFGVCAEALGSSLAGRVGSVYDLRASDLGTFDLVMCFGLLYHLRHPLLALERLRELTSGTLLLQTHTTAITKMDDVPFAQFCLNGVMSGPGRSIYDPTVYWQPNPLCVRQMLEHVGFTEIEQIGMGKRRTWQRRRRSTSVQFRAR